MKFWLFCLLFWSILGQAQVAFTRKDSLKGGLRFERTCYDVQRYDLNIKINPEQKSIIGYNDITFKVLENTVEIQLDLFENMHIDSLQLQGYRLKFRREFDAVFITTNRELIKNSIQKLRFYYSGFPVEAKRPPWDGGFVFTKDARGKDWIGVAVQGKGASLWYPCKEGQSDEPDLGASLKVAVPNGLTEVSNGRLTASTDLGNGYTRWDWEIKNPINNYNLTINVGDYVHFGEKHKGLDLDYYVLRGNEIKAESQFKQVKLMLDCFQEKFGPYPFLEDGYKLVQTPYLGMEQQSGIAYGNQFLQGYAGTDLSKTGIGLLFDYIIIHESAHEWFGNSITSTDIAEMWIHEAFAMYAESVFVEYYYGYEKAIRYVNGNQVNIRNDFPIIGVNGVNHSPSNDMYYKGALFLNTLRHVINDDKLWWATIRKFATYFRHQIIDTKQVIDFFNAESGRNLSPIFDQYLKHTGIPNFEYKYHNRYIEFRWNSDVKNFDMPIDLVIGNKKIRLYPTTQWQKIKLKAKSRQKIQVLQDHFFITTTTS